MTENEEVLKSISEEMNNCIATDSIATNLEMHLHLVDIYVQLLLCNPESSVYSGIIAEGHKAHFKQHLQEIMASPQYATDFIMAIITQDALSYIEMSGGFNV